MNVISQIWEYLLDSVRTEPEFVEINGSLGELTVAEVRKIALEFQENHEEWRPLDRLVINLYRKTENQELIWIVGFYVDYVPEPYVGHQASLQIADKTGQIINKAFALR